MIRFKKQRHLSVVSEDGIADGVKPEDVKVYRNKPTKKLAVEMKEEFEVETLEGVMRGKAGDFLIEGLQGEVYPCAREIFMKSYEEDTQRVTPQPDHPVGE